MKIRAGLLLPIIAVLPCIAHCGASAPDPEPGTPGSTTQESVSLGGELRGLPLLSPPPSLPPYRRHLPTTEVHHANCWRLGNGTA
jgi:hypothetical protein